VIEPDNTIIDYKTSCRLIRRLIGKTHTDGRTNLPVNKRLTWMMLHRLLLKDTLFHRGMRILVFFFKFFSLALFDTAGQICELGD
jgi:hypothetical protein